MKSESRGRLGRDGASWRWAKCFQLLGLSLCFWPLGEDWGLLMGSSMENKRALMSVKISYLLREE